MKITTKPCKQCAKDMPKGLANVCSPICSTKYTAEKEKAQKWKKREKKAVSVSTLGKKADSLWSSVVRIKGSCEYCGQTEFLNAHHIFGRNNKSVRWKVSNGICLCSGCHTFSSIFSAHKTPTEFTYWLEQKMGRDWMDKLQELAHIPLKVTSEYLQEEIGHFKKILEDNGYISTRKVTIGTEIDDDKNYIGWNAEEI